MRSTPHDHGIRLLTRTIAGSAFAGTLVLLGFPGGAAAEAAAGGEPVPEAVWPVDPHPVVTGFDPPGCPYCPGHRGVDLGTLPLRPVRAAIAGMVTYASDLAGRGVIVIDDGTRRLTYEPVTATVKTGSTVSAGDVVGTVQLVGSHCDPDACLHLGLIDDASDDYEDPLTLFRSVSEVRLLPLWGEGPPVVGLDWAALF